MSEKDKDKDKDKEKDKEKVIYKDIEKKEDKGKISSLLSIFNRSKPEKKNDAANKINNNTKENPLNSTFSNYGINRLNINDNSNKAIKPLKSYFEKNDTNENKEVNINNNIEDFSIKNYETNILIEENYINNNINQKDNLNNSCFIQTDRFTSVKNSIFLSKNNNSNIDTDKKDSNLKKGKVNSNYFNSDSTSRNNVNNINNININEDIDKNKTPEKLKIQNNLVKENPIIAKNEISSIAFTKNLKFAETEKDKEKDKNDINKRNSNNIQIKFSDPTPIPINMPINKPINSTNINMNINTNSNNNINIIPQNQKSQIDEISINNKLGFRRESDGIKRVSNASTNSSDSSKETIYTILDNQSYSISNDNYNLANYDTFCDAFVLCGASLKDPETIIDSEKFPAFCGHSMCSTFDAYKPQVLYRYPQKDTKQLEINSLVRQIK
jgi:hypothetical protein